MIGEWDESVLYLLKNSEVVSALLLSAALYHYGLLGGEDNLFVTCLLRVIRNPSVKPLVAGALIGVVREAGIKNDLCEVRDGVGSDVQALLLQSYATKELVGVMLPAGHRSKAFFDELAEVKVEEVVKNAAVQLNVVAPRWPHP